MPTVVSLVSQRVAALVVALSLIVGALAPILAAGAVSATDGSSTDVGVTASEPPASEPPASEPPASEPPASEPPACEPPASEPPASEPPASEPPASEPPASEPPASEPPASEPPASEPADEGFAVESTELDGANDLSLMTTSTLDAPEGLALEAASTLVITGVTPVVINEIRIDQPGTDTDEFLELAGPPGTALTGLTYFVIGDGTGGSGVIESVISFAETDVIPASGLFLRDLPDDTFENSDNVTHLLVSGFTGASGTDLDTNDDGSLDSTPWAAELDRIALVESATTPPTGTEYHYGPPTVGPDGSFVPGHVLRCGDTWWIGPFGGADITPGTANPCNTAPSGVGAAAPDSVQPGDGTLLTVDVTAGKYPSSTNITVTGDLTGIGGSATQAFFDDGTNGDATAGDGVFSFSTTVTAATTPGAKSLPIQIADAQGRTGNASIALTVEADEPVVLNCGDAQLFAELGVETRRTLTADDPDGDASTIEITAIDPSTADITLGPIIANGADATADLIVEADADAGTYDVSIRASNEDDPPQTDTCEVSVVVAEILPIGTVQGQTLDSENGLTDRSPYAPPSGNGDGETVVIQGVIYQKTLAIESGEPQHGFFIQNRPSTSETAGEPGFDDGDPLTSDGIWVYMGINNTTLIGGYTPTVGDEIVLRGTVSEFFNGTQLERASMLQLVAEGQSIAPFETNPPDDFATAMRYWERREGMLAQIPALTVVQNGRNVFESTMDGEVWVIRGDHPVALRTDPYAQRVFRDAHPLDNNQGMLFDDGNGFRILMLSHGLKATTGDTTTMIAPARTFDRVTNSLSGGVFFTFGKYGVEVEQQPVLVPGVDPSLNAPPTAPDRSQEYSVSSYNVENLYDFRDDPHDGCDFAGNAGCPGVNPPFDYVPSSEAEYQSHLAEIAQQIITNLHAPDVLLIQEAEDQDICTVTTGAMTCGATNNRDGRPDTLQELAVKISSLGGPAYQAAYDRNGADDRGIVSAIMYRTDRVELLAASAADPVLGSSPTVDYRGTALDYNSDVQNPKALNADLPDDVDTSTGTDGSLVYTRPPQVALLRIWRTAVGSGQSIDVYVVSNHFSSTPDRRIGQRTEQALYLAEIVDALRAVDPNRRIILGGDFNVYPRPDDPVQPPSDQLGPLYAAGLANLWERIADEVPESAYSYIFQGQAQTLDSFFVVPHLLAELMQVRTAHVNADWPAAYDECLVRGALLMSCARGASDHDPTLARFRFPAVAGPETPGPTPTATATPTASPTGSPAGSQAAGTPTPQPLPDTTVSVPANGSAPLAVMAGLVALASLAALVVPQRLRGRSGPEDETKA